MSMLDMSNKVPKEKEFGLFVFGQESYGAWALDTSEGLHEEITMVGPNTEDLGIKDRPTPPSGLWVWEGFFTGVSFETAYGTECDVWLETDQWRRPTVDEIEKFERGELLWPNSNS